MLQPYNQLKMGMEYDQVVKMLGGADKCDAVSGAGGGDFFLILYPFTTD
jgi:hypothetical protein